MAKQLNIGDMKEHITISDLIEAVIANSKSVERKWTMYGNVAELVRVNDKEKTKSFVMIVNPLESILYDREDPLDQQCMEEELQCYRRTKMFTIEYNAETNDWTIIRLANYLTTQY